MSNPLYQKHIISISDFNREELELVVNTAAALKTNKRTDLLNKRVIASCFFEASTRTRLSFETAVQRLGGTVIGFADAGSTSLAKKGESLADSVRIISAYVDAFVMRHPRDGAARLAAEFSSKPVVNAGDGANQHPTQTLLDLFTIHETQGRLDGLNVAFVGDLKYGRTVHSLVQALSLFNSRFYFIAPKTLALPDYLYEELQDRGIQYSLHDSIEEVVSELDILYMTRVQRERFEETEFHQVKSRFVLTADILKSACNHLRVLHPLPRIDEIDLSVDQTPHAYYFQQAENGMYARQALLSLILNEQVDLY